MEAARLLLAGLFGLAAVPSAAADGVVMSSPPQAVAVTDYRAPDRAASEPIYLNWLNGYALITEQRRVSIPAGDSAIRFEGVSGGILPQSAIITGLPMEVVEKNQDAWLLSPGSLLDASLGKRIHLKRTSRATGAVTETEAIVRSGADGAVVLQTPEGVETLRCTGQAEGLRYDQVPPGLSAKPTLSVRVRSSRAVNATVTLSYLASEFDWQANYVGELSPDGTRLDLFAWLTLASGDDTSFVGADTQAVAGRLNRTSIRASRPQSPPLNLRCWPAGTTTSDLRELQPAAEEEIVVTGSRVAAMAPPPPPPPPPAPPAPMVAQQEELGDLKLYRIPQPVTVAAHSQKQVALLARKGVKVQTVYRSRIYGWQPSGIQPVSRVLKTQNKQTFGLGLPLPSGSVAMFSKARGRNLLLGKGALEDKAVGEEVEIPFGTVSTIQMTAKALSPTNAKLTEWEYEVSNSRPQPVEFELELIESDAKITPEHALARRNGRPVWLVRLPPNGSSKLRVRVERR